MGENIIDEIVAYNPINRHKKKSSSVTVTATKKMSILTVQKGDPLNFLDLLEWVQGKFPLVAERAFKLKYVSRDSNSDSDTDISSNSNKQCLIESDKTWREFLISAGDVTGDTLVYKLYVE